MYMTWIKVIAATLLATVYAVAQAGVIATDATPGWFDGDDGVRLLHIGEHGITGDLAISIDFAKCNDPGVGAGRGTVRFDDAAAWEVGSWQFNDGNVSAGSFRPVEALELLKGRDMFGDWKLVVGDAGYGDPLQYFGARLEVVSDGAVVAEPGMVTVMGAGLLALGASLMRQRRRCGLGSPPSRG
jgi:hypothetical protein